MKPMRLFQKPNDQQIITKKTCISKIFVKLQTYTLMKLFLYAVLAFTFALNSYGFTVHDAYSASSAYDLGDIVPSDDDSILFYQALSNLSANGHELTNTDQWKAWAQSDIPNNGEAPSEDAPDTPPAEAAPSEDEIPEDPDGGGETQNAKIVSVNVRGTIGARADGDLRIMGFKLTDTSNVLMRGVGPQLEDFTNGLLSSDVLLPDPTITLYKYKDPQNTRAGSDRITSGDNGDYSTNANISEIDAVRAVLNPVVPFHPKQAASMPSLGSVFILYRLRIPVVPRAQVGPELTCLQVQLPLSLMFQQEVWYKQPNTCSEVFRLQEPVLVKFSFADEGHHFLSIMFLMS